MSSSSIVDANGARGMIADPPAGLVVLDVRTDEEFAQGRLPGATQVNISEDTFVEQVQALNREVPYLLYCKAGGRSAKAAELMIQLGFTTITDFGGGWMEWAELGFEAEFD